MSVLEEAPSDRFPVQSYVAEYDAALIMDAIRRELRRGGQVFYLCNNIEKMDLVAARIHSAIPDARIAVANGQMDKEELSDIWNDMLIGETDILVCTTIIETGVDIPNANTLIIEDADKMGLSQLHQLRGRVGRSSRRAYAYFTYPENKVLTEIATKRLEAIRDFTEFGAGFKVAMRDLQIRGAGNILGSEQHGHMECVGYELYMRILEEAILEEKGETVKKEPECTVDVSIDAFIPEKYIPGSSHRLEAYKKISLIRNAEDRTDVTDELLDRYGPMPQSVANLLNVSFLRATGSKAGLRKIEYKDRIITFRPEKIDIKAWSVLAARKNGKLLVSLGAQPYISCRVKNPEFAIDIAQKLLNEYIEIEKEISQNERNSI
jgi:transcription-repair coupling factor (superfamily II helicase)